MRDVDHQGVLNVYLNGAGRYRRFDPDEERQRARELVELRRAWWDAALDLETRADTLALARAELKTRTPAELMAYAEGRGQRDDVIAAMMRADPDGVVLEQLHERHASAQPFRGARAAFLRARNRFMCANLRFVVRVVKRVGQQHLCLVDRVQEGNIGLLKAIHRFDPERGFRFSTYAAWWIRHALTHALARQSRTVRVPEHVQDLFGRVQRTSDRLRARDGGEPTVADVAEHAALPVESVRTAMHAMELRSISLDEPVTDGGSIGDALTDEATDDWPQRIADGIDVHLAIRAIDAIDPRAAAILVHRYGLGGAELCTLKRLAARYRLSSERVRQLQNEALVRLREAIEQSGRSSIAFA
jgi:RNA polymerase sigma factor (sigma-70 family)